MATFTVTTANDESDGGNGGTGLSLREAIALANTTPGADTINFAQSLTGQAIALTLGELVIINNLTISGLGANNLSVSGNNISRVFQIDDGNLQNQIQVTIAGLTITGGNTAQDGGGIFNQETLTLSNTAIGGNQSGSRGGGLFNGGGTVNLTNSTFSNNTASQDGGGVFNQGSLTTTDSTFSSNTAGNDGGGLSNSGTATSNRSTFTGNVASQSGGGLFNIGTATVNDSAFSSNRAVDGGGLLNNATATVSGSSFSSNTAANNGGGLLTVSGTLAISQSTFSNNSAVYNGGGLFSESSTTTLSNSSFSSNGAGDNGGGIFNSNSAITLSDSTFNSNAAGDNGGGLANESNSTAILSQNTFSGNTATNSGGGIYTQDSTTDLSNSTVTLNGAASGGGLFNLFNNLGSTTVTSTIVAGNTNNQDIGGSAFTSGSHNLIGNGQGASGFTNGVNSDLVGTAANPINPLLGPLQDNGGPTLTHALLAGSPALNAGSNPDNLLYDQRGAGFPRTLGGATDIGAIEQGLTVPGIRLEKATNAADPSNPTPEEDGDLPPGRPLPVGTNVTWTYQVFNEGNVPLTITSITDDFGTPNNPADDFTPAPVLSNGFNVGDTNQNNRLDTTEVWRYTSAGVVSYQVQGSTSSNAGIGGINLGKLTDYLFFFANGSAKANWQGATKGFLGDVAVNGISAAEKTSGGVPYAGTIYTNDSSLGAWQKIVDQNSGQAFASKGQTARISGLQTDLTKAFTQINSLPTTPGFTNRSSTSLDNLNTQDGINKTYAIDITSGLSVNGTKIDITGDAGDTFVLRWDTDANFKNGYQGQVKFYSGGAIVPHGGLTASNFIHVAGDLNASGGGGNPPSPYPQGPRYNNGTGALINGGQNFSGGGFFTGYWLTTGAPSSGKTAPFSNAIFVGGWYTTTTDFSMTSGTSGVHVAPPPPSDGEVIYYTNIAKVTAQDSTGKMVMDTDASSHYGINGQSIQGTPQTDVLAGTSKNDFIIGYQGQDTLTGSGGNDIFAYQSASEAGDRITDFGSGDQLSVLPLLNSAGYKGSNPFADGYLNFFQNGNNKVITFDADGKAGAASPLNLVTLDNFQGNLSYDSVLGAILPNVLAT